MRVRGAYMLAVRTVAPRYEMYSCQPALLETAVQSAHIVPAGRGGVGNRFARDKKLLSTLLVSCRTLARLLIFAVKLAQINITRYLIFALTRA